MPVHPAAAHLDRRRRPTRGTTCARRAGRAPRSACSQARLRQLARGSDAGESAADDDRIEHAAESSRILTDESGRSPPAAAGSSTGSIQHEQRRSWRGRARCDQRYGACPLRSARRRLRPLGGDPLVRAGSALAALPDRHVPVGRDATVLDVATGTGAIARGLVRRYGCRVVGVDQSPQMLDGARERIAKAGLADRIELRLGSAEELELEEGSFDALTTGYLLRYLDDPLATMRDLLRLIKPGRAVRAARLRRAAERRRARRSGISTPASGLPVLGRLVSPGWAEVGRYLRPSITAFGAAYPPAALRELLIEAGGGERQPRLLSLGGGLVAWGVRAVR